MGLLKARKKLKMKPGGGAVGGATKVTSNERPRWVPKEPPCRDGCPSGNDIRAVLVAIGQREKFGHSLEEAYQEAWKILAETQPLPAVCGRVCPHPCEEGCNRAEYDEAISINGVERFLGDKALEEDWPVPMRTDEKREEKIAVIGAGPAGISCAYQLARRGYPVTVFEAFKHTGGMLRYGIPAYRLPRDILDKEIQRTLDLGVELRLDTAIGRDIPYEDIKKEYKAVFVGIGAHRGRLLDVEGEDAPNVMSGQEFLNRVNNGETIEIGDKVLVIGGGDTAIDAARVSKRMGAKEVTIVYRRGREEMPAIKEEIDEAENEGIKIHLLAAPVAFFKDDDRATGMRCIKSELGEPDESGRRRPVPIEGSEFDIEATMVIAAISQEPDFEGLEKLREGRDWLKIDEEGRLPIAGDGVYAGGDATDLSIATVAIAQGRAAAETIDRELRGAELEKTDGLPVIKADRMKLDFYEKQPRNEGEGLPVEKRFDSLELEVNSTMTEKQALAESERCMSCGQCSLCGACWMYCQDQAIKEPMTKGNPYEFKLETCTGCKKCAEECPCGYIEMFL